MLYAHRRLQVGSGTYDTGLQTFHINILNNLNALGLFKHTLFTKLKYATHKLTSSKSYSTLAFEITTHTQGQLNV